MEAINNGFVMELGIKEKVASRPYIVESEAGMLYKRKRQNILKTGENLNNSCQMVIEEEY